MDEALVKTSLLELAREAFQGETGPGTWFADNGKGKGILGTLAAVSAESASDSKGPDKQRMAGHAYHILFILKGANAFGRGEKPHGDWESSWSVQTVSPNEWEQLCRELATEYEEFKKTLGALDLSKQESLTGAIGIVVHLGYHLGALRQLRPT